MNEQSPQKDPAVVSGQNTSIASENVQFEESALDIKERKIISKTQSKMAEILMQFGIIESERAANFVLAGVAVFFFMLSILIFILGAARTPTDSYVKSVNNLQDAKIEAQ